eukprot:668109-Hanusia_phi.AAC.1
MKCTVLGLCYSCNSFHVSVEQSHTHDPPKAGEPLQVHLLHSTPSHNVCYRSTGGHSRSETRGVAQVELDEGF